MPEGLAWLERAPENAAAMIDRIFAASRSDAVWSDPVQADGRTIITACEVAAGGGFGFGFGRKPQSESGPTNSDSSVPESGGGGGGGGSSGRPVAMVIAGPEGVRVQPVVDVTKIALLALTTWGALVPILAGLKRATRK